MAGLFAEAAVGGLHQAAMSTLPQKKDRTPLCPDLDGTLVRTDSPERSLGLIAPCVRRVPARRFLLGQGLRLSRTRPQIGRNLTQHL
jgi:hypothetical protein